MDPGTVQSQLQTLADRFNASSADFTKPLRTTYDKQQQVLGHCFTAFSFLHSLSALLPLGAEKRLLPLFPSLAISFPTA